jgi:hypothetical protein
MDILDLEFINNHLYVLSTSEILNLEYSGQLLELIDKINCIGCYKLEQENSSLVLICEDGIHLKEKIFSLNCKIVNCKIFENELYYLNEIGEIHKSDGDQICKIGPSLDFIIVENNGNKLIFTAGEEINAVYDLNNGTLLQSLGENFEYKTGFSFNYEIFLNDGQNIKKLITKMNSEDLIRVNKNEESRDTLFTFPTHLFLISNSGVQLKTEKGEITYDIEFYKYKIVDECLITISKEEVVFISPLVVLKIQCFSSNCLITDDWIILYKDHLVNYVNIKKRKLIFLHVFEDVLVDVFLINNILIFKLPTKTYISVLMNGPKPYVELDKQLDCVDDVILMDDKIIKYEQENYVSYYREGDKIMSQTINYVILDDIKELNPIVRYKLGYQDMPFTILSYFESSDFQFYFSTNFVHVFKENHCLYSVNLGDYQTSTVDKHVYIGYNDFILVYEVNDKEFIEINRFKCQGNPLVMKFYNNFLIVSLENAGLAKFKDTELIQKDYLYRTIEDFLVFNDKIYCYSTTGSIYIYNLEDLKPLASIFVGKCVCLFVKNSVYYVTNFGEVGEIVEISKETALNLSKIERILIKSGLEYFPYFTRSNFYSLNYLKEVLKLRDESLFEDFENREISLIFKYFLFDL